MLGFWLQGGLGMQAKKKACRQALAPLPFGSMISPGPLALLAK